jgi:hypothetical protein
MGKLSEFQASTRAWFKSTMVTWMWGHLSALTCQLALFWAASGGVGELERAGYRVEAVPVSRAGGGEGNGQNRGRRIVELVKGAGR